MLVYLKDTNKFKFIGEGGQGVARQTAATRLQERYPDRFKKDYEALAYLDEVMQTASTTSAEMRSKQAEVTSINWNSMYERLGPQLPVVFAITDTADKLVFTINEEKEVRKITFKNKEDAVNALQKDNRIWRQLKTFYNSAEELIGHHHKLSFSDWVKRIVSDYLLLDETKQIDPEEIKRLSWDLDDYAFKKFNPSKVTDGPTPTWDEFTSRIDYPEVFMAWVWGIVEPYNNIRQALWMVGDGNDGKSAAQNALSRLLGHAYVKSMQKGEVNEKFFLSSVFGKVLINYADSDDIYLITNPKIKQITGGDVTSIEFKSKDSFSGDVYSKLFVTSNKNPKINPESRAQVTRIIRLEVAPANTKDAGFEDRLVDEIWHFLWKCKECYLKYIDDGQNRLVLPDELQEKIFSLCASESYNLMQDFIYNRLEFGSDHTCPLPAFKLNLRDFAATQHLETSQLKYLQTDVEEKMHMCGVKVKRIVVDGQMQTCYVGLRLKPERKTT